MGICVVLSVYNGAKFLGAQLDSLEQQTSTPQELRIVDDGSTDESDQIIRRFALETRIRTTFTRNERHLHFTGSFLLACSEVSAPFVAFCDQDDLWLSSKLERILCFLRLNASTPQVIIHEGSLMNAEGVEVPGKRIPDLRRPTCDPPFDQAKGFAMIVQTDLVRRLLAAWDWDHYHLIKDQYGAPLGHDLLLLALALDSGSVGYFREQLVRYRVHDANVTATDAAIRRIGLAERFHRAASRATAFSFPAAKWLAEAAFVDALCVRLGGAPHLSLLAMWLRSRAKYWTMRSIVYESPSRLRRASYVMELLRTGGYQSRASGFTSLSLARDIVTVMKSR